MSRRTPPGFSEVLIAKARAGCRVRVLLSHPDNPALPEMINPQIPEEALQSTVRKIAEMTDYFRSLVRASTNIEILQIRSGCPHFQLTRSDQVAIVIQYLHSESSHYSPLCQYPHGSPLYATMGQEFESLWRPQRSR